MKSPVLLRIVGLLICCTPITLLAQNTPQRDQWVEEILVQLSEFRKSQAQLREEVNSLRKELQEAKNGDAGSDGKSVNLNLSESTYPVDGVSDALVAIVEFSDFECPFCRRHAEQTFPTLKEKYIDTGKVKYVFLDFPLGFHNKARDAAVAAHCAGSQGKYWEMHKKLFEGQRTLGEQQYRENAVTLGLDAGLFESCLRDPSVAAKVQAHAELGERFGVQGTPAFFVGRIEGGTFVNVKALSGAQSVSQFERVVDRLLAEAKEVAD